MENFLRGQVAAGVKIMAEILVIDDELQMRSLIARVLKGAGHTVHEASNGRQGIDLYRRENPALVIMDIIMPDMEGIETIRALRREAPTLPILAISGSIHALYLDAATTLGATGVLAKPFGVDELLSAVGELFNTI